jgi:hypothetical protein
MNNILFEYGRISTMKITQVFCAALTLVMLGGPAALAQSAQATQGSESHRIAGSNLAETMPAEARAPVQAWAPNMPHQPQMVTPQVNPKPKRLPFANFGQWDEAASEN